MKKLLRPGIKLKRWVLMFFAGILSFLLFLLIAFGDEFAAFISLVNRQLNTVFSLPLSGIYPKLVIEIILLLAGIIFLVLSMKHLLGILVNALLPDKKGRIASLIYRHVERENAPKIVVIGGGTGLNSMLRGLKEFTNNITAIVSVSDEGGSSKKLRYEYGVLPPGDIRNCIVALSDSGPLMAKLMEYRFSKGKGLEGHSFGNLLITALSKITGSFEKAVLEAGKIFAIRGRVLPVTLQQTSLCAELENGKRIQKEPEVEEHKTKYKSEIKRLYLKPANVKAYPQSVDAIKKADIIILGPGSLYTSILPNLLVKEIREAVRKSKAAKAYICNVMTQPGETDDYKASDHLKRVVEYLGEGALDHMIVNSRKAGEGLYRRYRKEGAKRVKIDEDVIEGFGVELVKTDLLSQKNLLRHDPRKLAKAVLRLV
ncbi:MAG: YvcK family protein [Candidatus Woesearchaeota archaeon]